MLLCPSLFEPPPTTTTLTFSAAGSLLIRSLSTKKVEDDWQLSVCLFCLPAAPCHTPSVVIISLGGQPRPSTDDRRLFFIPLFHQSILIEKVYVELYMLLHRQYKEKNCCWLYVGIGKAWHKAGFWLRSVLTVCICSQAYSNHVSSSTALTSILFNLYKH